MQCILNTDSPIFSLVETMSDITTPSPEKQTYFKVNGVIALTEFTVGASLNLLCFCYFLRRSTSAVNSLFLVISFVDICMCSNMLLSAISALNEGAKMWFSSTILCNMWGLVWHTGQGLSIFLVALLAFARYRCMTQPLKKIKRRTILLAILVYTAFQIFKSTLNYWYVKSTYQYNAMFLGCTVSNINTTRFSSVDKSLYFSLYICEILVPAIPIVAFSIGTMICLKKSSKNLSALGEDKMVCVRKRDSAVTMLFLVGAYLFFNTCYWGFLVGDALYVFSDGKVKYYMAIWGKDNLNTYYMTYYAVYIHSIILNSTANAVIYFIRLKKLRLSVNELVVRVVRKIRGQCQIKWEYKNGNTFSPASHRNLTLCTKQSSSPFIGQDHTPRSYNRPGIKTALILSPPAVRHQ